MNLIGISGYAGSGKDEVAMILCYLSSGSTLPYKEWLDDHNELSRFSIRAFADKLKSIASVLTGIPIPMWSLRDFKDELMPPNWQPKTFVPGYPGPLRGNPVTGREFLQQLGDAIRRVNPDAFVNALFRTYSEDKKWIIPDVRMVNESNAVAERGGLLVRVYRPGVGPANEHWSETALNNYLFPEYINNDGSIDDLVVKVKSLYERRIATNA